MSHIAGLNLSLLIFWRASKPIFVRQFWCVDKSYTLVAPKRDTVRNLLLLKGFYVLAW